jgi:hypothetical protein
MTFEFVYALIFSLLPKLLLLTACLQSIAAIAKQKTGKESEVCRYVLILCNYARSKSGLMHPRFHEIYSDPRSKYSNSTRQLFQDQPPVKINIR